MSVRRLLVAMLCSFVVAGAAIMGYASRGDANTPPKRLTPGVIAEPQNGRIFLRVFNPTDETKHVVITIGTLAGNWDNTALNVDLVPNDDATFSTQCTDVSGCLALPTVSPAGLVPSGEYESGSGKIGLPAGTWRKIS